MKLEATVTIILASLGLIFIYLHYFQISSVESAALASLDLNAFPSGNYECEISRSGFDGAFFCTMYISDRKVRIDCDYPAHSHIIAENGTMFAWKDGQLIGLEGPADLKLPGPSMTVSKNVSCKRRWQIDAGLFQLPTDVDFAPLQT